MYQTRPDKRPVASTSFFRAKLLATAGSGRERICSGSRGDREPGQPEGATLSYGCGRISVLRLGGCCRRGKCEHEGRYGFGKRQPSLILAVPLADVSALLFVAEEESLQDVVKNRLRSDRSWEFFFRSGGPAARADHVL